MYWAAQHVILWKYSLPICHRFLLLCCGVFLFWFGLFGGSGRGFFAVLVFSVFFFSIANVLQLSVLQCFLCFSFSQGKKAQEVWACSYAFGFSDPLCLVKGKKMEKAGVKQSLNLKHFYFLAINKQLILNSDYFQSG